MSLYWFFAGALTSLGLLTLSLSWLRTQRRFTALPAPGWPVNAAIAVLVAVVLGIGIRLDRPKSDLHPGPVGASGAAAAAAATGFGAAAKAFKAAGGDAARPEGTAAAPSAAGTPSAGPMESAVANLEKRLAAGGGSDGDWDLLAKSFEFLSRPEDASLARQHKLPTARTAAVTGKITGEITLSSSVAAKASSGATLFIVAKSVDSPGAPVAVMRGSVGDWPLKFTLDDSQSMMPGRTLSTAGRVTIEARISQKGQPIAASGDLQGSSGVIDPSAHQPLKIVIDRVIS
jgi:hypothetical protein